MLCSSINRAHSEGTTEQTTEQLNFWVAVADRYVIELHLLQKFGFTTV